MDEHRIKGAAKQVSGSIKEAAGKVIGNRKVEAEGVAEKAAGEVESGLGKAKDRTKDALRR